MKSKEKIVNYTIFAYLFIIFLYMLFINMHTHKYHDEFVYTFIYGTTEKCENLIDIFISLKNLYLMHNGRLISTGIMCILLMLPKILCDILNSLFFTFLVFIIFMYSSFNKNNRNFLNLNNLKINNLNNLLNIFFIFPLLWVTIPEFNGTITWFSGAVNYMWSTVFMLLYLSMLIKYFINNATLSKSKLTLLFLTGLIVGSLHESIGIINTSFLFFMFIYEVFKNKNLSAWWKQKKTLQYLFLSISSFIGFLTIILSPGSKIRSLATTLGNAVDFHNTISNSVNMLILTFTNNKYIFICILFFIIYFIAKNSIYKCLTDKYFIINMFFIISGILVYIAMIKSPTFAERVTFAPYILFILSFFGIFNLINISNKVKFIIKIMFIIYFSILAIPSIWETTILVKQYYDEWYNRDEFIKYEKSLGKTNIQVTPFFTKLNNKMYGGDISASTSYNHNGSMSMYYGLDSIRIKKNFYLDFNLGNLCKEDNCSCITLSSISETSTEAINILPEYVLQNQAPYKNKKYSTIGGNITLYYGVDNIKNLRLSFSSQNDHITLNYIHVYNYKNLDYTLYSNKIKNKIYNKNDMQILYKNNCIMFDKFGKNPYIDLILE